ncbi:hypothetical protein CQA88_32060, partial [Klebsiella pneumoniae]
EKRARERELLASWYQPIPEPESPIATKPLTPPTTASKPPVERSGRANASCWPPGISQFLSRKVRLPLNR